VEKGKQKMLEFSLAVKNYKYNNRNLKSVEKNATAAAS